MNRDFRAPVLIGHVPAPIVALFPDARCIDDTPTLALDREAHDLTLHCFGLHWADDPVGQIVQSRLALVADGLFLGVTFGGATLHELRASLAEAETRISGGLSPRVLPMADIASLGGLLQRAGLALPVADSVSTTVRYRDIARLASDLRGMGETNALATRSTSLPSRKIFREAESIYRRNFADDGYLVATFEMVFLTGWAPSANQQRPLRPGTADIRLAEALGATESRLKR
ncbi:MAG: SAM-dependent methyltransferase [Boseongicola sp. SB0664_bin_43]|uniref:SAM-dependent methyltransferase n=1 Tax=Boseongicola sp. SB0664_bin_43 TaxID=2604844 RepID=A0A6B0XZW6_9RHOB|nr:SAM-dependent methyltransferase [Boseongicola sp. SB0664_bin_43]